MTIAERQAREAHDRENPWRNMNEPRRPGLICNLQRNDMAGHFDPERLYVEIDGRFWDIESAFPVYEHVVHWRPAHVVMTPERQRVILRRYENTMTGERS
jgi:hypothetical protein